MSARIPRNRSHGASPETAEGDCRAAVPWFPAAVPLTGLLAALTPDREKAWLYRFVFPHSCRMPHFEQFSARFTGLLRQPVLAMIHP